MNNSKDPRNNAAPAAVPLTTMREFQAYWNELLEDVESAVEYGASRREALDWAEEQYAAYASNARSLIYGPAEPTFDVQGRL